MLLYFKSFPPSSSTYVDRYCVITDEGSLSSGKGLNELLKSEISIEASVCYLLTILVILRSDS